MLNLILNVLLFLNIIISSDLMIPEKTLSFLKKQKYGIAGNHSLVKICQYTKDSLTKDSWCYKNKFYGIMSHQCLQATTVPYCFNRCLFCWRAQAEEGSDLNEIKIENWDEPDKIIDEMIKAQRFLLAGIGGHYNVNKKLWKEAQNPRHVALSLIGEPIAYPKLLELLQAFKKRKMSTFLVTAGSAPGAIENMLKHKVFPTQLYLSMGAYDKESFEKIMRPTTPNGWERYIKSLELLNDAGKYTRTVIRMTLIKGLSLKNSEQYAKLIKMAMPHYVEVKSYMAVGFSRKRIGLPGMPLWDEIREFAEKLAKETGYIYTDEHLPSRIVLLSRDEKAKNERIIDFEKI